MLWFTVWALLVLATVVTAVVLWRRLWRQARALAEELRRAEQVADRLAEASAALDQEPPAPVLPGVLGDPGTLDRARATRERVHAARQDRSAERVARVSARWERLGLLP